MEHLHGIVSSRNCGKDWMTVETTSLTYFDILTEMKERRFWDRVSLRCRLSSVPACATFFYLGVISKTSKE